MEHREGSFNGQRGIRLYYQAWLPTGSPRTVLLVVHGLAEHGGRYANLASYFVPKGYAVYSFDYCGHGKSGGLRCYVHCFSDYLDDLHSFVDIIRKEQSGGRIFLVGHSMGGTIAVAYAAEHQQELAGMVISAPTVKMGSSVSPVDKLMAPVLSALAPKMGVAAIDASAISRDKAVVTAYVNDPLVYRGKIRARLGAEMLKVMQQLPSIIPRITLPTLIMQGTADRLSNPEGSRMLYGLLGSPDKTLKQYEGFYHEIFNEPGHEQVLTDMADWLTSHA